MFGWEFPPHIAGGLGTACYGIVKGLMKNSVDVIFVVPKAYGDEDESVRIINASNVTVDLKEKHLAEFKENLKYIEIDSNLVPYQTPEEYFRIREAEQTKKTEGNTTIYSSKYEFSGTYGENIYEEIKRYAMVAAEIASKEQFDIIHAHDWLAYEAGIAAKKVSGKPLVAHIHATEYDRSGENVNEVVFEIEKKGMSAADTVIAVSHLTKNVVVEKHGIDPEKVVVVHNAVEPVEKKDFDQDDKSVEEKIVTFLGRITFQKGPEYFIEAARKVMEKDDRVRFVMAGSGDMMEKMVRRVAAVKMGNKFHFTGFLRGSDVDRMFALSDVYVMPSVSEPFGISPLEAMRSNVPVIISKQSGVAEVLRYALKIDFWDVDAMADNIYALLHYKGLTSMFLKHGKQEVDDLKWENATKIMAEVYRMTIEKT